MKNEDSPFSIEAFLDIIIIQNMMIRNLMFLGNQFSCPWEAQLRHKSYNKEQDGKHICLLYIVHLTYPLIEKKNFVIITCLNGLQPRMDKTDHSI